jgi:hypothetical protein
MGTLNGGLVFQNTRFKLSMIPMFAIFDDPFDFIERVISYVVYYQSSHDRGADPDAKWKATGAQRSKF